MESLRGFENHVFKSKQHITCEDLLHQGWINTAPCWRHCLQHQPNIKMWRFHSSIIHQREAKAHLDSMIRASLTLLDARYQRLCASSFFASALLAGSIVRSAWVSTCQGTSAHSHCHLELRATKHSLPRPPAYSWILRKTSAEAKVCDIFNAWIWDWGQTNFPKIPRHSTDPDIMGDKWIMQFEGTPVSTWIKIHYVKAAWDCAIYTACPRPASPRPAT